mmetsp:Transcript_13140/g.35766  ORF Transcript_13140/g.35766 Transcript_13140/m.35766 type:complete len:320 (-) Transcript_13140:288-1247(-)|eukprot:CAMPEP_0202340668 /NCGR_PEP_ID=MMETSP1126-20121109/2007_1 /ASSEMBLY_ACC=CAM_ASM_000457 /TAXON_ID=3047 /ORGANISM="Dunaliella tertiolecta, Strain CCMP1320" /LENGTH=319 /DNA_ID=CAMNT_0048931403 /DNA_START=238 /DNA_END=1197 /DNA_ORIENTATION=-
MGEQGGAQLLISLLTLALAASALPRSSQVLYTQADDEWAAGVASIAEGIVKTSSSCVPENTVILTMSNGYHWSLLDLKLAKIMDQKCFFDRYLVITIDADAHAKCNNHTAIQHCFLYHTELAPSDWKKADYYAIVYIKIKAMKALMERGLPAFFFDTDIVFFKVPPFPPPNSYDLVYQMEHFDMACELKSGTQGGPYESADKSCRGHGINTGQFGLWPSNTTITLLSETFKCGLRSTSPGYRGPPIGTQDCMNGVAKRMPHMRKVMLPSHFGGHCFCRGLLPKLQLTTYHANCVTSEVGKMKVLLEVASKGRARELDGW